MQLVIDPSPRGLTPEVRAHNKVLLEKYMPDFAAFSLEARNELGASWGLITIKIPDGDLDFVNSLMDSTKRLVE